MLLNPGFSSAETSTEFRDAVQSLSDGRPALAAQKLERLLNQDGPSTGQQDRQQTFQLLLEALVRDGKYEQAIALFSLHDELQKSNSSRFWNALALTENGNLASAQKEFQQLLTEDDFKHHPYHEWATLALAQNQARQKKLIEARDLLKPLLDTTDPEMSARVRLTGAQFELQNQDVAAATILLGSHENDSQSLIDQNAFLYLRARIAMQSSDFPKAIAYLENLRKNENPAFQSTHQKAVLLLGEAYLAIKQKEQALSHFLHLIKDHPDTPFLYQAFDQLLQNGALSKTEIHQNLKQWANEDAIHPERQAYAQFHLAQDSVKELEDFVRQHPSHPVISRAQLRIAELLIAQKKLNPAQALLKQMRLADAPSALLPQLTFLQALASFKQGDYIKAESQFSAAENNANKSQGNSSDPASFNVALTALHANDDKTFRQYQHLLEQGKNQNLQAELLLEQALFLAPQSVTQAFDRLALFLEKNPQAERTADAHLALAELYLNEVPPKPVSAREHLEAAAEVTMSQQQQESLDYIAVWIEESDGNHSGIIEQALRYLDHWPRSQRSAEIRMKLGAAYYQEKDYFQAINTLEQVAAYHPDSPLAAPALFAAGKAASLSKQGADQARAIELWGKLAENESTPLALYARHEQGIFKLKLDEFDDAIAAFDSILEHQPAAPTELRLAVLADRGQAMFNLATAKNNDTDLLLNAIHSFDSILSESKASLSWRNQAAVRKAKCLERLGRVDDALSTYHDVVKSDRLSKSTNTNAPVAQVDWFFRAGLGAIRLFREKKEWQNAIHIADSLANSGSPRAIEAAKLADYIRLKHFIWDQPQR
ncbi:MAG: tetratricopeptide repeat protein [Verrucomicrobiota bacterium]